jgi:replicative DNA helicase
MASETGTLLLSAIRKSGSVAALRDTPEDFFGEDDEKAAFAFLRSYYETHRGFPNPVTFLRHTGIQTVITNEPLTYYVDLARRRTLYYSLLPVFSEMKDALEGRNPDQVIDLARRMQEQASAHRRGQLEYTSLESALAGAMVDFEEAHRSIGIRGVPTGWEYADAETGGWQRDDLISIVGRPGAGKTYVLLKIAYSAWRAGYNVLFTSMELGVLQVARRMLGLSTAINPRLIRSGQLSPAAARDFRQAVSAIDTGIPFNIVAGGFKKSTQTVMAVAEATNPDLIIVDASYLLAPERRRKGSEGRREMVSDTIEDLKRIGLDLSRPVIQSVQFNRQAVRQRRETNSEQAKPTAHLSLERIGETDVIGQASSIVLGIAKDLPPNEDSRRWLDFLKGREGEAGLFQIAYEFQPVNFDQLRVGWGPEISGAGRGPDLSHMA